jgi:hypothetical protein
MILAFILYLRYEGLKEFNPLCRIWAFAEFIAFVLEQPYHFFNARYINKFHYTLHKREN